MRHIEGVIFDLDGVIVDTIEYHYQSWCLLGEEEGISFTREENDKIRGLSREDSLRAFLGDRQLDDAEFKSWLKRKNAFYHQQLAEMQPDHILPGVRNIMQQARELGLKLAVGSASRNARIILQKLQLTDQFDVIGDGNIVVNKKPAPDIFLWTAGALGLNPLHCLVLEDGAAGVKAAQTGGFPVVGLGHAGVDQADVVLDDLANITLSEIISRLPEISAKHKLI
jgi:beta-phosphoglucomutase